MTGFELLSVIRRRFPSVHVIAMSGSLPGRLRPQRRRGPTPSTRSQAATSVRSSKSSKIFSNQLPTRSSDPTRPSPAPNVALWVSRRGTPIEGQYILLTCNECLRSFPHPTGEETVMRVSETSCIFCGAPISYALLDHSITHHPGYAPSATP